MIKENRMLKDYVTKLRDSWQPRLDACGKSKYYLAQTSDDVSWVTLWKLLSDDKHLLNAKVCTIIGIENAVKQLELDNKSGKD